MALERGEAFNVEMVCACARHRARGEKVCAGVDWTPMTLHIASTRARRLIAPLMATITEYGMTNLPNVFRMP
jgi:hypothetical protein